MLTPAEYLKDTFPENGVIWLDGMDIIRHCLKKDGEHVFFPQDNELHPHHWETWSNAMQDRAENQDNFQEVYENAYNPKQQTYTIADDNGLLDVSAFIAGEALCFDNDVSIDQNTEAVSVLMSIGIPYSHRDKSYMETRHQKVYDLIAQCDSENRPIQVIGCFALKIEELKEPFIVFIVLKNYSDGIFPTIWGVLKNNLTANCFLNVIIDYFVGTKTDSNGVLHTITNAEQYFAEHENLIIYGDRINAINATYIQD